MRKQRAWMVIGWFLSVGSTGAAIYWEPLFWVVAVMFLEGTRQHAFNYATLRALSDYRTPFQTWLVDQERKRIQSALTNAQELERHGARLP